MIMLYPWVYKKKTYRQDPHDCNSPIIADYDWFEMKGDQESGEIVGEITEREVFSPPAEKYVAPESDDPEDTPIDDDDVAVEETLEDEAPPIKEPATESMGPTPIPVPKEIPPVRTRKEIMDDMRARCGKLGISFKHIETRYRQEVSKKLGAFNKNQFCAFCKTVEGEILQKSSE
jgi:hypothetical protein